MASASSSPHSGTRSTRDLTLSLTRLGAHHSKGTGHPEVDDLKQQFAGVEDAVQGLHGMVLEGSLRSQRLETLTEKLTTQLLGLEHAMQAKVGSEQLHATERRCTAMQRQGDEFAKAYDRHMRELAGRLAEVEHTLGQGPLGDMAQIPSSVTSRSQLQVVGQPQEQESVLIKQVEAMLNSLQSQIASLEQTKASAEQVQQISKAMATASLKTAALQENVRSKAEMSLVDSLGTKIESAETQLELFEGSILAVCKQLETVEQQLQDKPCLSHLEEVEKALRDLQTHWNGSSPQDKMQSKQLGEDQYQELMNWIRHVDAKCEESKYAGNQLALHETEGSTKLQQLERYVSRVQSQLAGVDDKVGVAQFLPVKRGIEELQAQVASMEKLTYSSPDAGEVRQLEHTLTSVESKLAGMGAALQAKADNSLMQELHSTISDLESQIGGIKSGVFEVVDSVQAMHTQMVTLKKQVAMSSSSVDGSSRDLRSFADANGFAATDGGSFDFGRP